MPRVLLVTATTGYQMRAFAGAARRLDVDLAVASDRCHVLDDPWRDRAIPIRFHDAEQAVRAIVGAAEAEAIDGVIAAGDRPAVIAAGAARALGLPGHAPSAARVAANKLLTRARLREAGLSCPRFCAIPRDADAAGLASRVGLPCVVKPLALSASRGVIRADTPEAVERAVARLRRMLDARDVRALRDPASDIILAEEYVEGREVAVEGLVTGGRFRALTVFDKPDPLEGPFFEETIYVTPTTLASRDERRLVEQVEAAAAAIGLTHGPVHAECRLNASGVFVIDIAARSIGGLCARSLRFEDAMGVTRSFEELLLQNALGRDVTAWQRAPGASGVMMIPIPRAGRYQQAEGIDNARRVPWIDDIVITAAVGQAVAPPPEGGSYLGFLFARAPRAARVVSALRRAHRCLRFDIRPAMPLSPRAAIAGS